MPKQTSKKQETAQTTKVDWKFANISLDAQAKQDLVVFSDEYNFDDVFDMIADMLTEHKVSLSYNGENDHFIVSVTGTDGGINEKITCSSFARDLEKALIVAAYKHQVIAKGDYRSFTTKARNTEDFG